VDGEEEEEGVDRVPELTGIPPQLQHLAKNRPRRPKRHASSGALGQVGTPVQQCFGSGSALNPHSMAS
jgi:hypothetical protein